VILKLKLLKHFILAMEIFFMTSSPFFL